MVKAKSRQVLSVRREGPDYGWFHLNVDGVVNLHVNDDKVVWQIDEETDKTMAYIQREYYQIEGQSKRHLQVKRVRIVGPENQIKVLLCNLGEGTPSHFAGPYWDKKEEDIY